MCAYITPYSLIHTSFVLLYQAIFVLIYGWQLLENIIMKKITINFSAFVYFVFFLSEKWQYARSVLQSGSVLNPGGGSINLKDT